jgi:feruloyl esterase
MYKIYFLSLYKKLLAQNAEGCYSRAMVKGLRRYEFGERLAEILGVSRRDLRFRVTLLVTGGLIAPGSRGPGSPPATPDYAADLLIGVMAAPQQAHTVEAIRCYRELQPTALAADAASPGVAVGRPPSSPPEDEPAPRLSLSRNLRFGEALARLLDQARDRETRAHLARELFGIWVSRGFPVAAVQLGAWRQGRRTLLTQRYELPDGARPPAWLDPDRGGAADPGMFHSVFLPVSKLIEIGALTASPDERKSPMLEQLGPTIANLAALARQRRNRRPWERFLTTAEAAETLAEKFEARPSRFPEVVDFGTNPGDLRMFTYVPADLPEAPALVVVLHGCTQTAVSYDDGSGWSTLADRHGFALLLPEQKRKNNPLRCFNWFRHDDMQRDLGEPLSIRQMIDRMIRDHGIDRRRIFVTGLSAGGAMTSVMLATYPELFAGGAIVAGVPYRCAHGVQEAFDVIFQGQVRPAGEWGDRVRTASPHTGPWPKVAVWHGAADATVKPLNAEETVKQWLDVHGLAPAPTVETAAAGYTRRVWRDSGGEDRVEAVLVAGMGHGQPVDPDGIDGCGKAAPFFPAMGISSAVHIAGSWGLTATRREPVRRERPVPTPPVEVVIERPAAADTANAVIAARREQPEPGREPAPEERSKPAAEPTAEPVPLAAKKTPEAAGAGGVDLSSILAAALGAAGLGKGVGEGSGPLGIDIPGILSKSFEAAGLLKGEGRGKGSAGGSGGGSGGGTARGIDIESILAKSFEAAGLLGGGRQAAEPSHAAAAGLAGSGWEGEGWQLLAEASRSEGEVPPVVGTASSGIGCDVGNKVRTVSRALTLGARPKLRYRRKLDLSAAINILTTASFRVIVDGITVDEVSVVGMDYAESEWTERTDIDLARFAGRTVTLSFELAANSNVCIEVFAKAWLAGIAVDEAPAGHA